MNASKRRKNLTLGKEELEELVALDFEVVQFAPFHFRINGSLDVWPSTKKWYAGLSGRKGTYDSLIPFVYEFFTSKVGRALT
jgi:hypothetical protein